ncbi:MRC1-like domain-containing protein [Sparassis latifolia]
MANAASPSSKESPIVHRAIVTYGRRTHVVAPDTSITIPNIPHTRVNLDHKGSLEREDDISTPPSTSDAPLSPHLLVAAREEASDDGESMAPHFQFSWRQRMQDIDDEYSGHPLNGKASLESAQLDEANKSSHPGTPTLEATDDVFDGPLPILTSSSQPANDGRSPIWSPAHRRVVPPRPHTRKLAVVRDSDSDVDAEADHPSTPHSSAHQYNITTPPSRSSPTPPTSLGAPLASGGRKGKERAVELFASDEELNASDNETHSVKQKGKGKQKQKRLKRPTKKEREETQKTTARIVADRPVSLPRVENKKFGMMEFLGKLKLRYNAPPSSPSDPIQAFSSSPSVGVVAPTDDAHDAPTPAGTYPPETPAPSPSRQSRETFTYLSLLGPQSPGAVQTVADQSGSDEEMPDVGSLLQADHAKRTKEEQRKRLQQEKLRLVELQKKRARPDEGDDSDLEVVQDDMKVVIEEEAKGRRVFSAHKPSVGRKKQLTLALRSSKTTPHKRVMKQSTNGTAMLEFAAASVFTRPADTRDHGTISMSHTDVSKFLLQNATKQAEALQRAKEEEWVRRGGRLKGRPESDEEGVDTNAKMRAIISKACSEAPREEGDADGVQADDESGGAESDGEYHPDDESTDGADAEDENHAPMTMSEWGVDSDEDSSPKLPLHAPRFRRGRPLATLVSDDEDVEDHGQSSRIGGRLAHGSPLVGLLSPQRQQFALNHRGSLSSLEDRTEDGTDKENDERLMFDRGEDKENTSIVIQPSSVRPHVGRIPGSILGDVDLWGPDSAELGDCRLPLKELLTEDDPEDPFLFTPSRPPARQLLFSVDARSPAEYDVVDESQSGFSKLFEAGSLRRGSQSSSNMKGGGLSQFFIGTASIDRLGEPMPTAGPSLTLDVQLQPALEVNEGLRRKADSIFDKEQEYLAEASNQNLEPEPKLYVDENGFLTQTKPKSSIPQTHQLPSPSQLAAPFRAVLGETTLSTLSRSRDGLDSDEFEILAEHPSTRLMKRRELPHSRRSSPSPSPQRPRMVNAFDLLRRRPRSPTLKGHRKLGPSEFIEGEAEESDEDAMLGFGGHRRNDDDAEESDDNQDQTLAELVDDTVLDKDILAEHAVLEKVREHQQEDDRALEKVHMDAIEGKYRTKRRDRGVGFDGSDSDDDDEARRLRRNTISKKRKIDRDSLEELARHQETLAFVAAYHAEEEDAEDFAHMQHDEMTLVDEDGQDDENAQEVTSFAQIYNTNWGEVEAFDSRNIAWIERDHEDELSLRVKEVTTNSKAGMSARTNWDAALAERPRGVREDDERNRARMQSWARSERTSRNSATGYSTGGSVVTGHGRASTGGSVTGQRRDTKGSEAASQPARLTKASSALSAVPSRRSRFGP